MMALFKIKNYYLSELRLLREGDPAAAGGFRVPEEDDWIQGCLIMAKIIGSSLKQQINISLTKVTCSAALLFVSGRQSDLLYTE